MITEYTDCVEFMRLISEQKVKPSAIKRFLSQQGIIITATNSESVASDVYTILLGGEEMAKVTQSIISDGNYEKSTLINAKIANLDSDLDILDYYADNFNARRSSFSAGIVIEQPIKTASDLTIFLSYKRKLPGKNKLLQEEQRHVKIVIRKNTNSTATIDIRHPSSFDAQKALQLLEETTVSDEHTKASLLHVNLNMLTVKNKVEFFDRLSSFEFSNWRLITVTGITVKQSKLAELDEDSDEYENEMLSEDNDSLELSGISQAILNGSGLRSNEFVQNSLSKGYYISSMKYRYSSKQEASEFVISISSRDTNLRVDIDKSYAEEDGRIYIHPLAKSEQDEIIQKFQSAANEIFNDLLQEQRETAFTN